MNRLQHAAIITNLATQLKDKGSWCGETHLQKTIYFLQKLLKVPLEYEYILYKHGPFSFDLRDELGAMYADGLLKLTPQPAPYGPKIVATPEASTLQARFPNTLSQHERKIAFIAETFGDKGVSALEGLATAYYVTQESTSQRAERLHKLKPHITMDVARGYIEELDAIIGGAKNTFQEQL